MSFANSQCEVQNPNSYQVVATTVGGMGSASKVHASSLAPTVDISGLDVCRYNYSFVGSVFNSGGVQSELSSIVSFSVDLSGRIRMLFV